MLNVSTTLPPLRSSIWIPAGAAPAFWTQSLVERNWPSAFFAAYGRYVVLEPVATTPLYEYARGNGVPAASLWTFATTAMG